MRKLFLLLLVCIFPVAMTHGSTGQQSVPGKILAETELREIFMEVIKENLQRQVEEIAITDFSSRPSMLAIPAGRVDFRVNGSVDSETPGKKTLTVTISVGDENCGEVTMSGDLHFWGTVVILSRNSARRTILAREDIQTDFRDISMLGDDLITDPDFAVGKKLKKTLRKGALLSSSLLENPQIVKRGDRVTIMARSDGLQVTAPGEAKNSGAAGDMVRVKNIMSRRVVQARVVDEGLVEIDR